MTECERIIKEGILPESFFKPETICDFYVDEKRKKIWAVLIDLLAQFDKVCRKYNLKYWMAFGGLLGIVRHNGFIPWDDDLDVCMPREDYDELMKHADEFQNQYYLQIPMVDDGCYYSFAKLRNSNTTGISLAFRYQNFNQGCFLDIFPLDNCCKEDLESNANIIKELLITNSTNMKRSNPNPSDADLERFEKYPYTDPKQVFEQMDKICRKHNNETTDLCGTTTITFYKPAKMTWLKSDVDTLKEIDFYGLKTFIPDNYDTVLRTTYGNYLEFPPVEQRGTWHNDSFFDPDNNYKFWIQKLRDTDKNIKQ